MEHFGQEIDLPVCCPHDRCSHRPKVGDRSRSEVVLRSGPQAGAADAARARL